MDKSTKRNDQGFVKKMGDGIEKVGEKLREAGAKKLGDSIYREGDKIEHSQERKVK